LHVTTDLDVPQFAPGQISELDPIDLENSMRTFVVNEIADSNGGAHPPEDEGWELEVIPEEDSPRS
jgi:hypothetical protein